MRPRVRFCRYIILMHYKGVEKEMLLQTSGNFNTQIQNGIKKPCHKSNPVTQTKKNPQEIKCKTSSRTVVNV